mgnify:CR=1 FL=1
METVGDGFDVILGVIDKIAAFQEKERLQRPSEEIRMPMRTPQGCSLGVVFCIEKRTDGYVPSVLCAV